MAARALPDVAALSTWSSATRSAALGRLTERDLVRCASCGLGCSRCSSLVDDPDRAAALVNDVVAGARAMPRLSNHDGRPWHVHYFAPDAALAEHLAADCGMALARVIADGELDRLRRCEADDCDHVLVDLSRNRSKRYCDSRRCGNRIHVAAYRERRRAAALGLTGRSVPEPALVARGQRARVRGAGRTVVDPAVLGVRGRRLRRRAHARLEPAGVGRDPARPARAWSTCRRSTCPSSCSAGRTRTRSCSRRPRCTGCCTRKASRRPGAAPPPARRSTSRARSAHRRRGRRRRSGRAVVVPALRPARPGVHADLVARAAGGRRRGDRADGRHARCSAPGTATADSGRSLPTELEVAEPARPRARRLRTRSRRTAGSTTRPRCDA